MKRWLTLMALLAHSYVYAQGTLSHGPLRVSDNSRYLVHRDGTPFFWLGDTAWELFHRLNRDEAERYFKRRAEQGFTVIQAVALAEIDGLNDPNALGDKPLIDNDPAKPNEAYFKHVDYLIERAAANGLVIGLLPTWGDKLFKAGWGVGPEIFNVQNARVYGRWIGNRYKDRPNIVWILGGDRTPRDNSDDVAVWRAMADGLIEGVGGHDKALVSFHPQPNALEMGGSSHWFHADRWLDFNMLQNGHCRDTPTYDKIAFVYSRTPTKPVIDAEPIYEDHPVCFNVNDLGLSNAYDVRKYAYLDLFAGAHGHTYGCHDVWQMYAPNRKAINGARIPWNEALNLPAANQMRFVRQLMTSRPVLDRVPDQSLVQEANYGPADRIQATRGNDYAFVYTAAGRPFTVQAGKLSGGEWVANWYDPRKGETKPAGTFANKGPQKFTPPSSGYGQDWVLILDEASRKYPMPRPQ
ncbi:glycoside hydrolase family 140 protein [Rudanella lutea]|uniref:glycoside hydrolase family 140 protein n=1 Tax=Rudanella lutea TaxID=451374 RepID=UPI00047FF015|nr:glycoside hydrolase family 140 protein [Rudanella lutea]